ncbi:hypothetical protein HK414_06015 [Ramlibacter terrae]|uniref:Molecular chaperone n=1 Tax=Ramlibacter terrae TaxID=2732511 RepID=A0ABX6P3N4_9BURK|nr:hypothetical protein HK414_06015 [Ramlibacter terrae]
MKLLSFLLASACAALAASPAKAGEFAVSPVRIEFNGAARSQLLAITNAGDTPARFWSAARAGR